VTRIIAGEFGGRRLATPAGRLTRPTSDRVREAWMSILAARLPGARVLDLFAGTGALGLEALSRGAAHSDFVERAPEALALLRSNLTDLGVEGRARVLRADALRFAAGLAPGSYDVALADPPYADGSAARLVAHFRETPFAAVLSVEHAATEPLAGDDTRRYGDTAITFCYPP
jgi:16S rRNA (guanine966-N2)-methyltransferase